LTALPGVGLAKLCETTIAVSHDIVGLFQELISSIVIRSHPNISGDEVDNGDMPKRSTLSIGFFLDDEKEVEASAST
jgi:hypothetical protein